MTPMELMTALNDVDDDALLRAEQDPPRHRAVLPRLMRWAAAACMTVALILLAVVPLHTDAGDNALTWTQKLTEYGFSYEFWNSPQPEQEPPNYAPTWLPEGFRLVNTNTFDGRDRTMLYYLPQQEHLEFGCYYVGKGSSFECSSDGSFGTMTLEKVTIGPYEADHYRCENGNGWLIWIDREQQLYFSLRYGDVCGAENALRVARSIRIIEEELP